MHTCDRGIEVHDPEPLPRPSSPARRSGSARWRRRGTGPSRIVPPRVARSEVGRPPATERPPVSLAADEVRPADGGVERRSRRSRPRPAGSGGSSPTASSGRAGVLAEERLAGRDGEHVRAEPVEHREQRRAAGVGDREDRDHRRDADRDADRRERGPELAGGEAPDGDPGDLDRPGPPGRGVGPARGRGSGVPRTSPAAGAAAVMPAPRRRAGRPTIRPSCSSTRRGSEAAMSRSWVMTAIVAPSLALRSRSRSTRAAPVAESRFPVGSSARTIAGRPTSARAIGDPLALAARQLPGPVAGPVRRARRARAPPRPRGAAPVRGRPGTAGRRRRCRAPTPRRAGGSAGRRTRSARPAGRTGAGRTGGRPARRRRSPRPRSPGRASRGRGAASSCRTRTDRRSRAARRRRSRGPRPRGRRPAARPGSACRRRAAR